jgi:hypothetical protein
MMMTRLRRGPSRLPMIIAFVFLLVWLMVWMYSFSYLLFGSGEFGPDGVAEIMRGLALLIIPVVAAVAIADLVQRTQQLRQTRV